MTPEEREQCKQQMKIESWPIAPTGGQQAGTMPRGIRLVHEETDFDLKIYRYRSQIQNKELAITLFELYLSTFI